MFRVCSLASTTVLDSKTGPHRAISNSVNCPKAFTKLVTSLVESERCAENELMMFCSFYTCR